MAVNNRYLPININESMADSRSLIMPHQSEAVKAMTKYFKLQKDMPGRSGVVVMPTGSGKTYTAVTWLLKDAVVKGYKVVWLVHRQELIEQTFNEFRKMAPLLKGSDVKKFTVLPISGIHLSMSSARRANAYVCGIQSVANKNGYRHIAGILGTAGKEKVVVVVDEAHHATSASYQKVLNRIKVLNPNMVLLGLTATPYRMNEYEQNKLQSMFNINSNLSKGIGKKGFVYEITLKELIASGFLADPKYIPVYTKIIGDIEYNCNEDDEEFFKKFGELSERLKTQIAESAARNDIIIKEYLDNHKKYGKTLVFAVNQLHAEKLCELFKQAGITCDYTISSRADSQDVIRKFKDNEFEVLINVQILTEGSDVPDIQTVFLTRQTNSDSLLMQMIGRGLRGEKAHGTKTANIVAFHDKWNRFAKWLDPAELDIFEDANEEIEEEVSEPLPIVPNTEIPVEAEDTPETESRSENIDVSLHDVYMKLYDSVRAEIVKESGEVIFPVGWYSVLDLNGEDHRILVFDQQVSAYKEIAKNLSLIIANNISTQQVIDIYFEGVSLKPDFYEINMMVDYINETEMMPEYYSLDERDSFDPSVIAKQMLEFSNKREEQEKWLEELFNSKTILQDIYRYLFAFMKTVFDTLKTHKDAELVAEDDRKEYNIVSDYYDLNQLMDEVLKMYPKLTNTGLLRVAWSHDIVRKWFGLCTQYLDGTYQIQINKLLSSPEIDLEVIKYLLFHELLHQNGYWNHDEAFRLREWQYPNSAELDATLDTLRLRYDLDEVFKDSVYDEKAEKPESIPMKNEKEPEFNPKAKGVHAGFKYCRNCGNKLPDTAKFCDKCGDKMDY